MGHDLQVKSEEIDGGDDRDEKRREGRNSFNPRTSKGMNVKTLQLNAAALSLSLYLFSLSRASGTAFLAHVTQMLPEK